MFDKLKSLFVVEDDNPTKPKAKNKPVSTGSKVNKPVANVQVPKTSATPSKGQVTSKFMNVLLKAMEANNLDGFDYLEYKHSLKSLEKMPMDEQTRFKSAFAMAQTMGATPDHLIKTANHYIRVLLEEESKFGQALPQQKSKQIGDKENQIKQLENIIKEKTATIERMKKEIEEHTKGMKAMKEEISDASVKVESTKNNFHASFNNLVSQIKKDIESMKSYLK